MGESPRFQNKLLLRQWVEAFHYKSLVKFDGKRAKAISISRLIFYLHFTKTNQRDTDQKS